MVGILINLQFTSIVFLKLSAYFSIEIIVLLVKFKKVCLKALFYLILDVKWFYFNSLRKTEVIYFNIFWVLVYITV